MKELELRNNLSELASFIKPDSEWKKAARKRLAGYCLVYPPGLTPKEAIWKLKSLAKKPLVVAILGLTTALLIGLLLLWHFGLQELSDSSESFFNQPTGLPVESPAPGVKGTGDEVSSPLLPTEPLPGEATSSQEEPPKSKCKHEHAECQVEESPLECCPGLICVPHKGSSQVGKCESP